MSKKIDALLAAEARMHPRALFTVSVRPALPQGSVADQRTHVRIARRTERAPQCQAARAQEG